MRYDSVRADCGCCLLCDTCLLLCAVFTSVYSDNVGPYEENCRRFASEWIFTVKNLDG